MLSLSYNNQADVFEAFNSTSRYLDDLLNIYIIPYLCACMVVSALLTLLLLGQRTITHTGSFTYCFNVELLLFFLSLHFNFLLFVFVCLSVHLFVCVCVCVCLSVCLSACMSVCLSVCLSTIYICVCLSMCLCVCLSVCANVCLYVLM